jgi:RHS repeat-associated protein
MYFPLGEVWLEERPASLPADYFFTAKEFDPETGFYDFGARYLDPRFSKWMSADPELGRYMPSGGRADRDVTPSLLTNWRSYPNLPGMGGTFEPTNLALYGYGHHNPATLTDSKGKETQVFITRDYLIEFKLPFTDYNVKLGQYGSHAAARVDNPQGEATLYDPAGSYNPLENGRPVRGSGDFITGRSADLESYVKYQQSTGSDVEILRFATTPAQEKAIADRVEEQGGRLPCYCANGTAGAISGIEPFKDIKPNEGLIPLRPSTLANQLKAIDPPPKVELREAPQ